MKQPVYGIDFGTTNSSIAVMRFNGRLKGTIPHTLEVEPNGSPDTVMKSIVSIRPDGTVFTGQQAAEAGVAEQGNLTVKSVKSEFRNSQWSRSIGGHTYGAAEIAGFILKDLKARADRKTGTPGEGAVMGVPVGFDDQQKETLQKAAILAGIVPDARAAATQIRFVAEPVAAAISYGIALRSDQRVMVFDFGGGTLDLTVMDMRNVRLGELHDHEVLAKHGVQLGGDDVDRLILKELVALPYGEKRLLTALGAPSLDRIAETWGGYRLMQLIERRKRDLSSAPSAYLTFQEAGLDLHLEINRDQLELHMQPMLRRIQDAVWQTLIKADQGRRPLQPKEIDKVILAGGSSLIPAVKSVLDEIFGDQSKVVIHDNPLTSIAEGLAMVTEFTDEEASRLSDITDFGYGIWDDQRERVSVIIPEGTRYKDTVVDRVMFTGTKKSFRLLDSGSTEIELEIYGIRPGQGDTLLHTARISVSRGPNESDKPRFDVYFTIDPDKGWLSLQVWDHFEHQWLNVPTDSQVRIKW